MKKVKCVVAATNANGSPDFYPVIVECTQEQYDTGAHYDAAKDKADENGFTPYLVYDQFDQNTSMAISFFEMFEWSIAPTVKAE